MISFDRVSKYYQTGGGRRVILDDLTMDIEAEKGLCILGMNGAGKSTLIRMISGAELPSSGKIKTDGRVSWPMGLSGTFQPGMSGRDNVRFVAQIYGQSETAVLEQVEDFAELGDYLNMPVGTYSSGMKSRLAFGLSLAISFDIYLIDEIISVGDRLFKEKSRKVLEDKVRGARVILISHHESTVRQFCDKCAILRGGTLEMYEGADEAFKVFNSISER